MKSCVLVIVVVCLCNSRVFAFPVPKNIIGTSLLTTARTNKVPPAAAATVTGKRATSIPVIWSVEYDTEVADPSFSQSAAADRSVVVQQTTTPRLFSFHPDGTEVDDLLPPLDRRLDLGIGCYFEESDRVVLHLLRQVQGDLHPADACWALEACKGDQTEALIRISVAQRLLQKQEELDAIASNLYTQDAVPIEWQFRRHIRKRNKNKTRSKLTGTLVARVALFLGLCRFVFSGAKVFFLAL